MKRLFIGLLFATLPLISFAQVRIGYVSYGDVLRAMPEYAQAQAEIEALKAKYEAEAARGEEEFQRKFADFLQGQKDFPQNILLKRQVELQSLMENAIAFRNEAQDLLREAERKVVGEVAKRLDQAIKAVGDEGGYVCVLNTDANQCPYVNPAMGDDVTEAVKAKLGIEE